MEPIELIERVRTLSPLAANALFDRLLPQLIPLAEGLDVHVREATDARCELSMPARRRAMGRLGPFGLGAQLTLADLTVAVALYRRFPPHRFRGAIRRVEADFHAAGDGELRCVCEPPLQLLDDLARAGAGHAEAWFGLRILDASAALATEARFLVALDAHPQAAAQQVVK